jgi:peptidoglycan/LPS O-acetylase OafA/YrhL
MPFHHVKFDFYREHQGWFWFYIQNWLFIFKASTANTTALHHYWSLAVEEQFYLVWPWLLLVFKSCRAKVIVISLLLLGILAARTMMWMYQIRDFNYFGFYTFTRADGLFIGSLLAVIMYRRGSVLKEYSTVIVFVLAALNFIFFFINKAYQFTFPYLAIVGYTTFAVMFALLIHEAVAGGSRLLKQLLKFPVLIFFGKYSYGLYIWHWPIYLLMHRNVAEFIGRWTSDQEVVSIIAACLLTIIAIPVSVASYHLYEKPFLKLKKSFK